MKNKLNLKNVAGGSASRSLGYSLSTSDNRRSLGNTFMGSNSLGSSLNEQERFL